MFTICRRRYYAHNTIQHVWGADREAMTFDPCSGAYVANVSSAVGTRVVVNTSTQRGHTEGGVVGGVVTVLFGRGAGQVRRLVSNDGSGVLARRAPLPSPDFVPVLPHLSCLSSSS